MTDYVLKIKDEQTAVAGFAAFGLTQVDKDGKRTVRQGGMTSKIDMEVLADAVEITKEIVASEKAKGTKIDATLVERKKVTPLMPVKPELKTLKDHQDYRRDLTEWCTVSVGERMVPTGEYEKDPMGNDRKVMVPDGFFYLVLRWNGDARIPPMPDGFEIIWSSASPGMDDKGFPLPVPEYPYGLPRFA